DRCGDPGAPLLRRGRRGAALRPRRRSARDRPAAALPCHQPAGAPARGPAPGPGPPWRGAHRRRPGPAPRVPGGPRRGRGRRAPDPARRESRSTAGARDEGRGVPRAAAAAPGRGRRRSRCGSGRGPAVRGRRAGTAAARRARRRGTDASAGRRPGRIRHRGPAHRGPGRDRADEASARVARPGDAGRGQRRARPAHRALAPARRVLSGRAGARDTHPVPARPARGARPDAARDPCLQPCVAVARARRGARRRRAGDHHCHRLAVEHQLTGGRLARPLGGRAPRLL
ncbi:MAG: Transcriptional regulator, LysR family, partial [uncultured Blastococcus sp.]